MTIVFLAPRFYPQIGGVEKHAYEIARRLSKRNRIYVITEGKKTRRENINGIRVIRLYFGKNNWFKKFVIWKKILEYHSLIQKADIVHCHDVFFWYLPLRIIYPTKKVYVTFHGYETIFPPSSKAVFIRKLSEKLSNGNISVGDYIGKWYGTKSNAVIYGAWDKVKTKTSVFNKDKKLKILFIGRIEKDTGVEVYSQALEKLRNFKFEACGDGSYRKEFEKLGKVHGFVKNLDRYIEKSDIVFASSYLSIIKAMSFKRPIFSVYENSLKRDYLKMAPFSKWIYIANSPKMIVGQIKRVMRDKRIREKNVNLAYNWASDQTWNKLKNTYLNLWRGNL